MTFFGYWIARERPVTGFQQTEQAVVYRSAVVGDKSGINRMGRGAARAPSSLVNRNIVVAGRRTSVRLEAVLWEALAEICQRERLTIHQLCGSIAAEKDGSNLTAAIRLFAFNYFRSAATEEGHREAGHGLLGDQR